MGRGSPILVAASGPTPSSCRHPFDRYARAYRPKTPCPHAFCLCPRVVVVARGQRASRAFKAWKTGRMYQSVPDMSSANSDGLAS
jgi:hypothetical protein